MATSPMHAALAQMEATPVIESPVEQGAEPTPEVETSVPVATPTQEIPKSEIDPVGTPTMNDRQLIQPQDVNDDGSMDNCSESSPQIPPGGTVSITCDLTVGVTLLGSPIAQITRPALPDGFSASITMVHGDRSASMPAGSSESRLRLQLGLTAVGGSRTARVTILLKAPTDVSAGYQFNELFDTCRGAATGGCLDQTGWVDIALTVEEVSLVDGTDYTASCTGPDQSVVGFGERAISTCSVTAGQIGTDQLLLNDLVTTLNGASGWSGHLVSIEGPGAPTPTGTVPGLHQLESPATLSAGSTFSWEIWLEPTACSAGDAPLSLSIRGNITLVDSNGESIGPITTSPRTIDVSFEAPDSSSTTAVVTGAPEPVNVPYSMTTREETESASLTVQYTVEGCEPWDGYVQMSPFSSDDAAYAGPVPELEGATLENVSRDGEGFTHLDFPSFTTINETPTRVIGGTEPGMEVQITQTISLEYTIPANTPVGEYESTITVSTVAAP